MQQVNFFECLEKYGSFGAWLSAAEKPFCPKDYLRKGERITTLMREKTYKMVSSPLDCISPSVFGKKGLASKKLDYAIGRIAETVVRPVLKEASRGQMADISHILAVLPDGVRNEVHVELCAERSYEGRLIKALFRKKDVMVVGVTVGTGTQQFWCCLDGKLPKSRHKASYHMRDSSNIRQCADLALLLAEIILIGEMLKRIRNWGRNGEGGGRLEESLVNAWNACVKSNYRNGCVRVSNDVADSGVFREWCDKEGVQFNKEGGRMGMGLYQLLPLCLMAGKDVSLQSFFSPYGLRFVEGVLCVMIQEHIRDKQVERYYTQLNRERASVWQTKKNIPEKVVRAMGKSGFNDFFGYVEFDEECDLGKVTEIEREFRALNTVFNLSKQDAVSLRFRKLGNYKASGLYFPSISCLCVDLRMPSSMAHECLHMIDHVNGMLCRKPAFYPVECAYISAFEDAANKLAESDPKKAALNGKSKYNREYYLQPMEIFARCGEIYLTRVLGVDNSLCVPGHGVEYPDDDALEAAVKEYFGKLF
jgi:hypothetical protein